MAKSPKICVNKNCGKELQSEDQYCASCGTKVSVTPWKILLAAGLVLLIVGIVAGAFVSKNLVDGSSTSASKNLTDRSNAYLLKAEGDEERKKINYQDAIDLYKESINKDPGLKEAWLAMGDIESFRRNFPDALRYYEKATDLDSDFSEAWMGMGNVSMAIAKENPSSEDLEKACLFYDRAIESSNAGFAYKEQSAGIMEWIDIIRKNNIETNPIDSVKLLDKALVSSNASVAIDQNDSESWTYRAEILRALSGICRDYNKSQVYKDEAYRCDIRSRLIEGKA